MNRVEQAKDMIRSFRYNGTPSSRSAESSGPLCEEMPSFEQYARSRKANRISSSKIKALIEATRISPQEHDRVHRIARNGYSRATLIQMYGIDGEVVCKRWLEQALGWHVADEITRTSASEPRLSGKADGRLCLHGGEEHLVEIKCTIHLADTSRFPLEDLPQLQANMECAGVRKTIYLRWNRFLCCAWLVEFDERYWTQFLLPEIQLCFSSPEAGVDDRKERRARFLNESRYSGPPRKLLFFARRQGFMWYDQHYKALSSCRKRKCTQQEQRDVDTRKRRHSHVADVGSPFSSIKEITIHGGGESKVLVVSKYFSNTHE